MSCFRSLSSLSPIESEWEMGLGKFREGGGVCVCAGQNPKQVTKSSTRTYECAHVRVCTSFPAIVFGPVHESPACWGCRLVGSCISVHWEKQMWFKIAR